MTLFTGQMVKAGRYPDRIDHYSVLNTIETMYGLPLLGDSLIHTVITGCWKEYSVPTASIDKTSGDILYPNPTDGLFYIELPGNPEATAEIYNLKG
jgi:hypothetical protein